MPRDGMHSISVPGAVAGWEALRSRFGSMPYSKILAPAIYYAEHGFPITEIIAGDWSRGEKKLAQHPYTKQVFLPNGHLPRVGEVFKNPDLAASLRRIAKSGPDGFYRGPTAEAILRLSKEMDGTFQASDLTDYKPEWIEPISTTYRGWTVTELPPNGAGVAALEMLNIMEQFPLAEYGHNSVQALHTMIEAKKLAYSDMLRHVGDPRFSKVPVDELISKELGKLRAAQIDPNRATCSVTPANLTSLITKSGGDTVYFTAADKDGNMVSFIQSLYAGFGSGLVAPGTGVLLHNRAALFTMEEGHPNQLLPRKRPLHTLIPGFLSRGDTRIVFGIMGGWNQPQAHAQFVSNIVDFGMNVQWALEAPRFSKGTFDGCDVSMESRIDSGVREKLVAFGHQISDVGHFSGSMGGGQAIMRDAQGVNYAGSDPRKDGAAIPQPPPLALK